MRMADNLYVASGAANKRREINRTGGLNPGQRTDAFEQRALKCDPLRRQGIVRYRQRDDGSQYGFRTETRAGALQAGEAAHQQARSNEQDQRGGHFENYHGFAKEPSSRTRSARAFLQSVVQIDVRCLDRGREAENYTRGDRQEQ